MLQGCGQSCSIARAFLYHLLERFHRDYAPIHSRTWVDDLRVRMWGSHEHILRIFPAAIVSLGQRLARQGCTLSAKSCLMASSSTLASQVAQTIKDLGVPIKVQQQGRDLGVDSTLGRRRRLRIRRARQTDGFTRLRKISKLTKKIKRAGSLVSTGAKPQ